MVASPFDSKIYSTLFTDPDMMEVFSDRAHIRAMVTMERTLARVQGRLEVIPPDAADQIDRSLLTFEPNLEHLAEGTERTGVPVPSLVAQLRGHITRSGNGDAARHIHWGATSQDVVDTALMMQVATALTQIETRRKGVLMRLHQLARTHRETVIAGRTRWQQAVPTSFGLKVAGWAQGITIACSGPWLSGREGPRLSFGGAAGNLAALDGAGIAVMEALSRELDLTTYPLPWHNQRAGLALMASELAALTGAVGKLAQDVLLMAQSEIGEVREGGEGRGGSSTMPNKSNPTRSEAIVALARHTAHLPGGMFDAINHAHERDGAAWQTEWMTLGSAFTACAGALLQTEHLVRDLVVLPEQMQANIEASNGLMLAEAASFALANHMPRPDAQALVKDACKRVAETDQHLFDILEDLTDAPVDWSHLRDPKRHMGEALALLDRYLATL